MTQDDFGLVPRSTYEEVVFHGDHLLTVMLPEGVAVPTRTLSVAVGIDPETQAQQLRNHPVLSEGLRVVRIPDGDQLRPMLAILHTYIPFWLATINPAQVGDAVRDKLIRYQRELVDVLDALYGAALPAQPDTSGDTPLVAALREQQTRLFQELRITREALLNAHQHTAEELTDQGTRIAQLETLVDELQQHIASHTTISAAQAEVIKKAVLRLAKRYETQTGQSIYARLFGRFCADLQTPKYAMLPAGRYEDALAWLRARAAELLPDDPDALPPLQERLL
jgi:hypothetical protein